MKQLNVTWIWFWFNMEFDVGKFSCICQAYKLCTNLNSLAFIIGCLVSFRALYTERTRSSKQVELRKRQQQAMEHIRSKPSGLRGKAQALQDVLLTTFHEWEDTTRIGDDVVFVRPHSAGTVDMDSEPGYVWSEPYDHVHGGADSARTLAAKEASTQHEAHVC